MPFAVLQPDRFSGEVDGKVVALYTLRNPNGMVCCITNYGAKITQLLVPDCRGQFDDVVLGYDSLDGVVNGSPSMGAFIGRYAGRIENSAFTLDGQRYQLTANSGSHCLHGGTRGSRSRVFDAVQHNAHTVQMRYLFAAGEEGFPGALALSLIIRLTKAGELVLDYEATAIDKPTVASFTPHPFFNLDGAGSDRICEHEVQLSASHYLAMTVDGIATGQVLDVTGTPHDFRAPVVLGQRMRADGTAGSVPGYDHCYVVDHPKPASAASLRPGLCARVSSVRSGRSMEVWTTEPALQLYTGLQAGQPLAGGLGKGGQRHLQQQGLCLQPQCYPNAPNVPSFPSSAYLPGQTRRGRTMFKFRVF